MGKTGIAQVASTDAVAPDVIDALPTQRHAEPTQRHAEGSGNGHGSPLRDALELSKLSLELAQLEGGALTSDELRTRKQHEREKSLLEIQKLHRDAAHEKEKNRLELQKLRHEAANEEEKNDLEMQKLRDETKNAPWSQYFELGKVIVPALAVAGSIYVAADNIAYQQNKDRAADISEQLVQFNDKIIDKDSNKQRNAIAAVRSLRAHAIPSLVTNLDLNHSETILAALKTAILRLNEDAELRPVISQELLSSVKHVALRRLAKDQDIDVPSLRRYIELWRECLRQYDKRDKRLATALSHGTLLANELTTEIRSKVQIGEKAREYVEAVNQLNVKE